MTTNTFDFTALIEGVTCTRKVRVLMENGQPWFAAADVRAVLGIQKGGTAVASLDADQMLRVRKWGQAPLKGHGLLLISESGLYKLIMRSDKPLAKPFQDWVSREVLPSIRKTGGYQLGAGETMPLPTSFAEAMRQHASGTRARDEGGPQRFTEGTGRGEVAPANFSMASQIFPAKPGALVRSPDRDIECRPCATQYRGRAGGR